MKYFQNISNLWGNVLTALGNTVYISLIAIVLGTILGIAMGVVLTYCKKRWQWLFRIYVDIMRGLPVLVTIFVVYYFVNAVLKMFFGFQMQQNTAGAVALTMFSAAQMTELTRGALQAIPKGQIEAGQAIGLSGTVIKIEIELPIMMKKVLPSMGNYLISLFKDTSIASAITVGELTYISKVLTTQTFRVFEVWLTTGILYVAACYLIAFILRRVEKLFL